MLWQPEQTPCASSQWIDKVCQASTFFYSDPPGSLETHQQVVLPGPPHLSFPGQALLAKLVLVLLVNPRASSESSGSKNYLCWLLGGTQQALTWRKALDCGCYSNSLSLSPTHLTSGHELNCELNSILFLMARGGGGGFPVWEYLKWKQAPSSLNRGNRDRVVTVDSRCPVLCELKALMGY